MKIVQINAYCGVGSTGKICKSISEMLTDNGIENYILYTQRKNEYPLGIKYGGNAFYTRIQSLKSRLLGNNGFNSVADTRRLIKILDEVQPNIVHLHNLHAQNCNLKILFGYLKRNKIKIIWTFHDCWAFTAYCYYFDMIACEQWKNGCHSCKLGRKHSWFMNKSTKTWNEKKKMIEGLDITVVTPSKWLAEKVSHSFFGRQKILVINNGIDLSLFKPKENDVREKYRIENKYMLLGVADLWDKRKGIDIFIQLSELLNEKFVIVLIGTNEKIDKVLPNNIISIHHTYNQDELVEFYSSADVFVNPTREEVLGLVNIEALACGTPVVTFDSGGSSECIDETCGIVVEKDNIGDLCTAIYELCEKKSELSEACIERAKRFDQCVKYSEYIELYGKIYLGGNSGIKNEFIS